MLPSRKYITSNELVAQKEGELEAQRLRRRLERRLILRDPYSTDAGAWAPTTKEEGLEGLLPWDYV